MHFKLENIEAQVTIGITPEERSTPQLLKFAVAFDFDPAVAVQSDDIADTIDYKVIFDTVKDFSQNGEWNLLETLHVELFECLKNKFPRAENLSLHVTKFPWEDAQVTVG